MAACGDGSFDDRDSWSWIPRAGPSSGPNSAQLRSGAFYAGLNGAQRQKSPDKKGPIKATANRGFRNPETPQPRECRARGPTSLTSGLINPKSGRDQKIRPRSYQRGRGECGEARGGEGPRRVTW